MPYITGYVESDIDDEKAKQVGTALAKLHEIPVPDYLPDKHFYVEITYPKATVINKIDIELSADDLKKIDTLGEDEFISYVLGHDAMIIIRKEIGVIR